MLARVLLPLLLLASVGPGLAASVEPGVWLSVKGRPGPAGSFEASSIEPSDADEIELRGRMTAFDPPDGELRMGPFVARLDEDTDYDDRQGRNLSSIDFSAGEMVKVTLEPLKGGGYRVEEVKKRESSSGKIRVDAPVESVRSLVSTDLRFRMLGLEVVAEEDTEWEGGLRPPRFAVDDEDARPAENISLGRAGTLSGEIRLDVKRETNNQLSPLFPRDLETARLRTDLEWTFPSTKHVSGMLELRLQSEWVLHDEEGKEDPQTESLRLGETWVAFSELFGGRGRLEIGRNRWDDGRDWWYRANLDSLRLRVDWSRVGLELAVAEQVLDPSRFLDDARHHLIRLDFALPDRHRLSLIALEREEHGLEDEDSFEPSWYGLHAQGRFGEWVSYWVDYAIARGRVGRGATDQNGAPIIESLRGEAHDVTAMLRLPGRWEPALTFGHARGSGGDDDLTDGVDRTFRQTGLHDNNAKFGGVTSLRYYGEVLEPELANLRVRTLGVSIRPRDWLSFELFWHDYEQDRPARSLVDASLGDDRSLNRIDGDVGQEWNFIAAWEQFEHWEVEVNVGVFQPSDNWLGGATDAWLGSLKIKYVF